jgi:hypothetical protein
MARKVQVVVVLAMFLLFIVVLFAVERNSSGNGKTVKTTATATTMTVGSVISTTTKTTTIISTGSYIESDLYNVTFQQAIETSCPPGASQQSFAIPWSVTIGNITKVQPTGTQLPLSNATAIGQTFNRTLAKVSFLLPGGEYQYEIQPSPFFTSSTGSINVNATGVVVEVPAPLWPCDVTTSTSR